MLEIHFLSFLLVRARSLSLSGTTYLDTDTHQSTRTHATRKGAKCVVDAEQDAVVQLLSLAAYTSRGQSATLDQKYDIENAISDLESTGSIVNKVTHDTHTSPHNYIATDLEFSGIVSKKSMRIHAHLHTHIHTHPCRPPPGSEPHPPTKPNNTTPIGLHV